MTGPNIPLLRKYVEWVENQEQLTEGREWLQMDWFTGGSEWIEQYGIKDYGDVDFCDTAFCFAGKVVVDAGWQPITIDGIDYTGKVSKDGRVRSVNEVASGLLGIPFDENSSMWGSGLFAPSNTAADIRRFAEDIAGERL